ncbi:MAG: hypothetical protein ACFFC7_03645 [Candidatus Hermodarchaeota archaeon]
MSEGTEVETFTYLSQLTISAIIPLIMSIVSLWLLYGYSQDYYGFFVIDTFYIGLGLILAVVPFVFIFLRIITGTPPVVLRFSSTVILLVPFLSFFIALLLFVGVNDAWQLAVGFFLGICIYPLIVFLYQKLRNVEVLIEVKDRQKYFYVSPILVV